MPERSVSYCSRTASPHVGPAVTNFQVQLSCTNCHNIRGVQLRHRIPPEPANDSNNTVYFTAHGKKTNCTRFHYGRFLEYLSLLNPPHTMHDYREYIGQPEVEAEALTLMKNNGKAPSDPNRTAYKRVSWLAGTT